MTKLELFLIALIMALCLLTAFALMNMSMDVSSIDNKITQSQAEMKKVTTSIAHFKNRMDVFNAYAKRDMLLGNGLDAGGYYDSNSQSVLVFGLDRNITRLMNDSMHEIGHYYWFEKMDYNESLNYTDDFNHFTEFQSDYAKKNAVEDFAEEFSAGWKCTFDINRVNPEKRNYFEVFK